MNDDADWRKPKRRNHILGDHCVPEDRQLVRLPEILDVRIVERLIESLPQREESAIQRGINDAEEQNEFADPHWPGYFHIDYSSWHNDHAHRD